MAMALSLQARLDAGKDIQTQARELQAYWQKRNAVMAYDRAMLTGTYKPNMMGSARRVFSNEPKNLTDLAVAIISGKPPLWRMPLDNKTPTQRDKGGKGERFIQGVSREVSRTHRRKMHGGWFQELTWYIVMGSYALFPHIRKREDDTLEFRWDIWDPMQVYGEPGSDGFQRLYRIYQLERSRALTMAIEQGWDEEALDEIARLSPRGRYKEGTPMLADDLITITNCFYMDGKDVVNAVAFDHVLVKEPTEDENFSRIPILHGPSNGMPFRDFTREGLFPHFPDWRQLWGESVIGTNRESYEHLDKVLTYMMEITRRHALPTYLDINDEGTITVDPSTDVGQMKVIGRKQGEDFKPLAPPTAPQERDQIAEFLVGSIQRGGLSHVAFGSLGLDISGVTLQQLLTTTRSKLLPYIATAQDVLGELAMETMGQFKRMGIPVDLAVWSESFGPGQQFQMENFDPKHDIPDSPYVEPVLPLALPDDTMERVQIARQAAGDSGPILDPLTILEDIMQVQDPQLIFQRLEERQTEQHPVMEAVKFITNFRLKAEQLRAKNDPRAAMMADTLDRIALGLEQSAGAIAAGNGGGPNAEGSPKTLAEPSPDVQPAEAGPMNPDRMRMAFNKPATPPTRTPGPQDRLKNMGLGYSAR